MYGIIKRPFRIGRDIWAETILAARARTRYMYAAYALLGVWGSFPSGGLGAEPPDSPPQAPLQKNRDISR